MEEIRGNLAQAETNYKKALAIRRQLNDLKDLGASLNNLGVINEMTGHFDTALVFHRENLRIQEQLRDTVKIARAQFNLAAAYQEMGLYPEAQSHLLDARLILEARNDRDGMAKVYTQLGHLQLELDRYSDALKWYTRALHMRERLDDLPVIVPRLIERICRERGVTAPVQAPPLVASPLGLGIDPQYR